MSAPDALSWEAGTVDLDGWLEAARVAPGPWTQDDVWRVLRAFEAPGVWLDWEPGDEEWGRVIDDDAVVALVCARVPVGVVRADLDPDRLPAGVSWLRCASMAALDFRVDRALLARIFSRSPSELVDYSLLSVDDLWWATV